MTDPPTQRPSSGPARSEEVGAEPLSPHVGAVDASTGVPTSWAPVVDGDVEALAVYGSSVYIGGTYLVFTSTEHIRVFTAHFDDLIRSAVMQPPDVFRYIETLLSALRDQADAAPLA